MKIWLPKSPHKLRCYSKTCIAHGSGPWRSVWFVLRVVTSITIPLFLTACLLQHPQPEAHEIHEALRLVDQGTWELRYGELAQAEATFQVALEIGHLAAALDGLGCVAFLRGKPQEAEQYFLKAWNSDPKYMQSLSNLALLYESQGLYEKAERLYQLAIREDPKNFRARNNFAGFLLDIKKDAFSRKLASSQLLGAQALLPHPLVQDNLKRVGKYE